MKDKRRAMGRGLGAILSAESKAMINSATDEGADKFVGNIVEVALEGRDAGADRGCHA